MRKRSRTTVGDGHRPGTALGQLGGQLDASAFEDGDDLATFLHHIGFDMQVCSQVDKTPSFSTIAAFNLSPAVIERMRPVLRVWLMRLEPAKL